MKPKVADLFAGCGGMSLGFQNAGFEIVRAYDSWSAAAEVYNSNFSHECVLADLSDEKYKVEIANLRCDVIIGGPPCQDFSHAGKRDETGKNGSLTIDFAEIVAYAKPRWFVMENVDRTVKTNVFKEAESIFREAGYGLTIKILDASLCGVPQKRKRLFVIGELGARDGFLSDELDKNLAKKPTTIRDYLGDSLGIEYYYRHPRNYNRRGVFSIDEPSPTVRGVNRPIPKGYEPHPKDATQDLSKVRPLTTIERSYLQTFPKNFKFFGSKTALEQMIGNAVPVKLAEYVARALLKRIEGLVCDVTTDRKATQRRFEFA